MRSRPRAGIRDLPKQLLCVKCSAVVTLFGRRHITVFSSEHLPPTTTSLPLALSPSFPLSLFLSQRRQLRHEGAAAALRRLVTRQRDGQGLSRLWPTRQAREIGPALFARRPYPAPAAAAGHLNLPAPGPRPPYVGPGLLVNTAVEPAAGIVPSLTGPARRRPGLRVARYPGPGRRLKGAAGLSFKLKARSRVDQWSWPRGAPAAAATINQVDCSGGRRYAGGGTDGCGTRTPATGD
jgi:hypothetical protein